VQPSIVKLSNQILPYAWGSRYAIAELQRRIDTAPAETLADAAVKLGVRLRVR